MIVAPHRRFAIGDFLPLRDVVPAVGAMVDAVEEQALVFTVGGEIGLVEERVGDG